MQSLRHYIRLVESKDQKLVQEKLPFDRKALSPVMSKATLDYHYGKLASAYVERFNKGEGDSDFNYGGATLHNLFFPQLQPPKAGNRPHGASLELIERKYTSFEKFKQEVTQVAMAIQGSGWVYMEPSGTLKVIPNHEYKSTMKIALIIDWWEHSWALDYQADKAKYLDNIWRIINWNVVNDRIIA